MFNNLYYRNTFQEEFSLSKLKNKKLQTISTLNSLKKNYYSTGFTAFDENRFRHSLSLLVNHSHASMRGSKIPKEVHFKEYDEFCEFYLDTLKTPLMKYMSRFPVEFDLDEFMNKNKGSLVTNGLQFVLDKRNLLKSAYEKEFNERIPKHPKLEHPLVRGVSRKFVLHAGPTNSGKTFDSIEKLKESRNGLYLAPLRLLALEIYEKLNNDGVPCSLRTGEEEIDVPKSYHISSTIEKADFNNFYDLVVIDEGQLVSDSQRGNGWLRAILGIMATEIHICCSLNAVPLLKKIIEDCEDNIEVHYHERKTPLIIQEEDFNFPDDLEKGDALIVFSRKNALYTASYLNRRNISTSVIYGNLPPQNRRRQVDLFVSGETDVVIATDAIGMGLNLPIKRVIFLYTEKFDGTNERDLTSQEVKQIAGRAGRMGIYPEGYVTSVERVNFIKKSLETKDIDLSKAFIKPLEETILNIDLGSLKEKLIYWTLFEYETEYIEKADISEQIVLLDLIPENLYSQLTEEQLYRAVHIPFNAKNDVLVEQWLSYLKQVSNKKEDLTLPEFSLNMNLFELETAYRLIDLYFSASKTFSTNFDPEWIENSRNLVADKIHNLLISNQTFSPKF
jgi:ATP-dependent RNA helicase SUPV3L1/SUV3